MKVYKRMYNDQLFARIGEIRVAYNFQDLDEKYHFARGFLHAVCSLVRDDEHHKIWENKIEQEYLLKRNAIHETQDIYEDTPFD